MGSTQWKAGKILLGVSQFLIFKCSDHIWVSNAGLWGMERVGGSRAGKQSADVCLHSRFLPGSGLFAQSSMQAWLRKELGGSRHLGVSLCKMMMPLALESISLLLLLLQLGAGTALCWQLAG